MPLKASFFVPGFFRPRSFLIRGETEGAGEGGPGGCAALRTPAALSRYCCLTFSWLIAGVTFQGKHVSFTRVIKLMSYSHKMNRRPFVPCRPEIGLPLLMPLSQSRSKLPVTHFCLFLSFSGCEIIFFPSCTSLVFFHALGNF